MIKNPIEWLGRTAWYANFGDRVVEHVIIKGTNSIETCAILIAPTAYREYAIDYVKHFFATKIEAILFMWGADNQKELLPLPNYASKHPLYKVLMGKIMNGEYPGERLKRLSAAAAVRRTTRDTV